VAAICVQTALATFAKTLPARAIVVTAWLASATVVLVAVAVRVEMSVPAPIVAPALIAAPVARTAAGVWTLAPLAGTVAVQTVAVAVETAGNNSYDLSFSLRRQQWKSVSGFVAIVKVR